MPVPLSAPVPRPVLIARPAVTTSHVVFASPHSGRVYPADMIARARVDARVLRSSEDAFVDLLLAAAPASGAPLVTTEVPRAYVDFNRAETELDPALIQGAPRSGVNPRVQAGLGVIARVVANGRPIYPGMLTRAEAEARLEACWRPYHAALRGLLEAQRQSFGQALLIDVHSMPHDAVGSAVGGTGGRSGRRPQIVLGDRHGASCRPGVLDRIEAAFTAEELTVARNTPFAGAYVAQAYGRPGQGVSVVQIEIDRALYMDETRVEPSARFEPFRAAMGRIVAAIADLGRAEAAPLAAE